MARGQQQGGRYIRSNQQLHFRSPSSVLRAARSLLIGPDAEVTWGTFLPYFTGMKHMLERGNHCERDNRRVSRSVKPSQGEKSRDAVTGVT